ncbi:MAG: hypothetical protein HRU26_12280, partial [Psychroserpens sp.]|nr:hypothetical protein [Psychroserpens sp.]
MKPTFFLFLTLLVFSCKQEASKEITPGPDDYKTTELDVTTSIYPESISRVFEAHGGIDTWRTMKTLEFTMPKESGDEVTLTDLQYRY